MGLHYCYLNGVSPPAEYSLNTQDIQIAKEFKQIEMTGPSRMHLKKSDYLANETVKSVLAAIHNAILSHDCLGNDFVAEFNVIIDDLPLNVSTTGMRVCHIIAKDKAEHWPGPGREEVRSCRKMFRLKSMIPARCDRVMAQETRKAPEIG